MNWLNTKALRLICTIALIVSMTGYYVITPAVVLAEDVQIEQTVQSDKKLQTMDESKIRVLRDCEVYNFSKSSDDQVRIEGKGEYRFTGDRENVRVIISPKENDNITVYFENGLSISSGPESNAGESCPAIMINEAEGATVTLKTSVNATATVRGCGDAPGIAKSGNQTKLVFDVEKSDSPGHLKVYSGTANAYAIGNEVSGNGEYTVGNIEFNAGEVSANVDATGPVGPGIGASGSSTMNNLVINGGVVNGGINGHIAAVTINGGHVIAHGSTGSAGIGSGDTNIEINGGTIEATGGSDAAGIEGKTVSVTGGHVTATGGSSAAGIEGDTIVIDGGNVAATGSNGISAHSSLIINGGTISAAVVTGGKYDINCGGTIKIDGGTIHASSYNKTPENSFGDKLQRTWFHIMDNNDNVLPEKNIQEINIGNIDYTYGINDVTTDADGILYLLLPEAATVKEAVIEDKTYAGSVLAGKLTDNDKKNVFLKESREYTITYVSNRPVAATNEPIGTMADSKGLSIDEGVNISYCEYKLEGYYFKNWCLTADNSGQNFGAGEQFRNDDFRYGKNVKLYAQWSPKEYVIVLDPGEGTKLYNPASPKKNMTVYYDAQEGLPEFNQNFKAPEGKTFIGWKVDETGSIYKDKARFVNLCSEDENGELKGYTLAAQYVDESDTTIVLAKDHEPLTGMAGKLKLVSSSGTEVGNFEEIKPGVYTIRDGSVYDGEYDIKLDGYKPSRVHANIQDGVSSVYYVNYYTITAASDEGLKAEVKYSAYPDDGMASSVVAPEGEDISLEVQVNDPGYPGVKFDRWKIVSGSNNHFISSQPENFTNLEQRMIIDNTLTLFAAADTGTYDIKFLANKPAGSGILLEGEMEDQTVKYGKETQLNANMFTIKGYRFDGWNTSRDGKGVDYKDRDTISNLGDDEHPTVHLYAKWTKLPEAKPALIAYGKAYTTSQTIGWTKVTDAAGYDIYSAKCGKALKKVKSVSASKTTYTRYKLSSSGKYKYVVKAYKKVNGKKTYIKTSPTIFLANKKAKYSNITAIKTTVGKITLNKGKTTYIKTTVTKKSSSKKILWKNYTATMIRYISTNKNVATVSSTGKITAKDGGSCYIYAIAPSGVYSKYKITVNL